MPTRETNRADGVTRGHGARVRAFAHPTRCARSIERLLLLQPRHRLLRDAEIEQLLARDFLLDQVEVLAAPEVLHLHDRIDERQPVVCDVGPVRGDRLHQLRFVERGVLRQDIDHVRVPAGVARRGIELLDALQIGHGEAHRGVAVLGQKVLAHRIGRDLGVRRDLVVVDDDRAPFVVLREEAELVGEVGGVHLALSEHAHEVGLRDVHHPLHVLGGIEAGLHQRQRSIVLVDAAERSDAEFLALELGEIVGAADALVVERLRHVDHGVAEALAVVAAVEHDDQRRALGDAVEQAGIRSHQREVEFAGDDRGHGEGAVLEALGLDIEAELLEVALLARDEECAAGDEGAFTDANEIVGDAGLGRERSRERGQCQQYPACALHNHLHRNQPWSTQGATLRSAHCCSLMIRAPTTASTIRLANTFSVSITWPELIRSHPMPPWLDPPIISAATTSTIATPMPRCSPAKMLGIAEGITTLS